MSSACECPLSSPVAVLSDDEVLWEMRVFTCAAYPCVVGWILVACCRGKSVAHAVRQSFHRLEWPWTCHRSAGANPTQEALRSSLLASRTQRGRNFFVGYGVISTALIVRSILVLHSVGLWGHPEHEVVHNVRDDYALLHTLVSSVLCLLVALMKPHAAINTMLHWAAFVQFLASQWLALDIVQYIVRIGQAGLGRVALAALLAKPRQDMFLNGLCTLNSLLRVASSEMLSAHFFPLVMFEIFVNLISCGISLLVESSMRRVVAATEAATTSSRLERTAHGLLSLVCDAVLYLDEHLCLEDHSQSLAALLLKNTGNSLRGERFGSSICEEDRERFELFMTGTCESAPAQCLHLHLRDTCGAKFLVEVFHYHLEGHHLLGIKEETERAPQPHEQEIMAVPSTGSLRWEHFCTRSASSASRQSSPRAPVTVIPAEEADFEDVTLTVDARSSHLDVLACAPPLPAREELAAEQRLLDWVLAPKRKKFQRWVKESTDLVLDGGVAAPLRVQLMPPHLRSSGGFLSECALTSIPTDEMRVSGECVVQIRVHKVRVMTSGTVLQGQSGSSHIRRASL